MTELNAMNRQISIARLCRQAKTAARALAHITTPQKNAALEKIADQIWVERFEILASNAMDVAEASKTGLSEAMLDRLFLDEKRLSAIIADLRQVTGLPDPVGEIFEEQVLPNGLQLHKQRVPLGVLGVIYESRPNVTVDVAGLALKSGNCVILRGGSETIQSNLALVGAIQRGLLGTDVPVDVVQLITDTDRANVLELLQMDHYIDMIIPRGGAGLHEFCRKNSRIPVITGGIGICHLFVDESADLERAVEVIRNAKVQRPSVCNALDTTLIHRAVASEFLPRLVRRLAADGVTFRADETAWSILKKLQNEGIQPAGIQDFDTEWLSLVLSLKVVNSLEEAIDHIANHSTAHSDGILTENKFHAAQFLERVDSAAVYVNASTRFTDGSQMGLGAEIAISTQRLHARGPMGLKELTTYKWIVKGDYNVRP
ncbi:MAG: glutamate-5-semialdehyde dehydrogenase [Chloroflexi bacterium]|nr:MAG: glutamate-5-semialdehyde dehydrogenase [Chloroflexota bacterium]